MNGVKIGVQMSELPKRVTRAVAAMTGPERTELSRAMGVAVQGITASHLSRLAATKHGTAERLGAAPTGHLAQAAEKVALPAALSADERSATIVLQHPGLGRAFHDVTIAPGSGKKFLTLPMNALAYGRRCGEFDEVAFVRRGQPVPQDIPAYALVRRVNQTQDRSLLPSDQEWLDAAAEAVVEHIAAL